MLFFLWIGLNLFGGGKWERDGREREEKSEKELGWRYAARLGRQVAVLGWFGCWPPLRKTNLCICVHLLGWGWGAVPHLRLCNRHQRKYDKHHDWLMSYLTRFHSDNAKSDGPIATWGIWTRFELAQKFTCVCTCIKPPTLVSFMSPFFNTHHACTNSFKQAYRLNTGAQSVFVFSGPAQTELWRWRCWVLVTLFTGMFWCCISQCTQTALDLSSLIMAPLFEIENI